MSTDPLFCNYSSSGRVSLAEWMVGEETWAPRQPQWLNLTQGTDYACYWADVWAPKCFLFFFCTAAYHLDVTPLRPSICLLTPTIVFHAHYDESYFAFLPILVVVRRRVRDWGSGKQEDGPEYVIDAAGGQEQETGLERDARLVCQL